MLKNQALYGAYQTGQTNKDREFIVLDLIENYFPALIIKEEWLLLQSDQNKSIRGRRTTHNPYSGLLRCSCGGALIKRKTPINDKLYIYHICSNAKDVRCSQKLGIKDLESALAKILDRLDFKRNTLLINR
ncbi:hypothetical protein HX889_41515 [Pseudomonas reactans]|nr:hypothetical protein [Pseudomonas reactans]